MNITLSQQTASTQIEQNQLWLVTANRLLVVSSEELHTLLQEEVASNPALELEERAICPRCGRALQGPHCPACPSPASASSSRAADPFDHEGSWLPARAEPAEEWDGLAQYATPVEFKD